ncbi:TBC1 domain family member 22B isoform X2 [Cimex lectularius]|uniref:Rab-GAP TBC domain-containing protein n=1 Tax=Cimex lectularius TaxID=79782 RepID=A0A8I6RJC5_CIMLE|nr:TBC1 domain family member 22B isoform X2 [Cimex lectularius]
MDGGDENLEDGRGSFWKKNSKPIPGRSYEENAINYKMPSPRKEAAKVSTNNPSTSSSTSFQEFQQSIKDVWDMGDDEFCHISTVKPMKKNVLTGDGVINIHKQSAQENLRVTQSNAHKGPTNNLSKIKKQSVICGIESAESHSTESAAVKNKIKKFKILLESPALDLSELQNLSWPGIPFSVKADTWRILSYAPTCSDIRQETLNKLRLEYWYYVKEYYESDTRDNLHQGTYRQIHIDIPRMSPTIPLFRQKAVQNMFERILFIWAVRHPESGYVQGINDLVTPFFIVFLHQVVDPGTDLDTLMIEDIDQMKRDLVEADSYWCFSKFLVGIKDNYIFPQLGIQEKISRLKELINRIDGTLHRHLQDNGVEYIQFSFRWMNNLLTRELPLRCLIRLWDTYLAELDTFASFQLFVCAAFLLHWTQDLLQKKDFQGLMLMLQNLPTQNWNDSDINVLVAEAYKLKCTFGGAPNHFQTNGS